VKLTFLGGAREVGKSAILLETRETKVLLDAGVKVGKEVETPNIENARNVDMIILTHAHLDHAGYVPYLVKAGFRGTILSTQPTRDLCQVLWADFLRIAKERGEQPYRLEDMRAALKLFKTVEYGERIHIHNMTISFLDAGHILGSAQVLIEYGGHKLLYSGDINTRPSRLHKGAKSASADVLIVESTYGAKEDVLPSYRRAGKTLVSYVNKTLAEGGSVLIPVFAIGRAQEVLLTLEAYMRSKQIRRVPIFIDGMVSKANRIYRRNVLYLREEIWKHILITEQDPFKSPFFAVPRTKSRKDVVEKQAIVVAPSGMLTGGPSVRYLELMAGDERNAVIIVGYQAEGTPGRALLEGTNMVEIGKKKIKVLAKVFEVKMSAHADRKGLVEYIRGSHAKRVFVVHGEERKALELAEYVGGIAPKAGETYDIRA